MTDKIEYDPTPEQQLVWIQEALKTDGYVEITSQPLVYFKEVNDDVKVVVDRNPGHEEIYFISFGMRRDVDDGFNTLARVGTMIADAMTGIIQKDAKNTDSADESVKNDVSVGLNVPTVHKPPIKMTQFTPTGTMIKNMQFGLKEIGAIKIGGLGEEKQGKNGPYRLPVKLDHFVVNTKHKDAQGNFIPDAAIMKAIGQDAKEIDVCLLYNDPTLNFYTRYNEYKGGKRMCSGDGEHATKEDGSKLICDPDTCATFKAKKCKANGILSVVLPDAPRLGGVYKFRTTSFNSIRSILSSMFFLQSLTGGILANIPLKLTVSPQSVNPVGSPTAQTIYVVNLEYAGTVDDLHRQTVALMTERASMQQKIAELESQARVALGMPESAEEILDTEAEFYPEVQT